MSIRWNHDAFKGRIGLELGGPSDIYSPTGLYPVYAHADRIDCCNFRSGTVWDALDTIGAGTQSFGAYDRGRQFFSEATDLAFAREKSYGFVLSSHMLEHSANPLKALKEWRRVLEERGVLLVVLPHRDGTFDHRRPVTSIQHLIDDFGEDVGEDDLRHLPEILALHDLDMDPWVCNRERFRKRSQMNFANRCLHHHVFDTRLAIQMLDFMRFQIDGVEASRPCNIAVLATKIAEHKVDNSELLNIDAPYRRLSPFESDRAGVTN
jgi:SAM-dependent methyltransferase